MNLFVAWQALTLWPNFDDWISVLFPRPSPYLTGAFYFPDLGSSQSEGYTSAQKLHKLEKKNFLFIIGSLIPWSTHLSTITTSDVLLKGLGKEFQAKWTTQEIAGRLTNNFLSIVLGDENCSRWWEYKSDQRKVYVLVGETDIDKYMPHNITIGVEVWEVLGSQLKKVKRKIVVKVWFFFLIQKSSDSPPW